MSQEGRPGMWVMIRGVLAEVELAFSMILFAEEMSW